MGELTGREYRVRVKVELISGPHVDKDLIGDRLLLSLVPDSMIYEDVELQDSEFEGSGKGKPIRLIVTLKGCSEEEERKGVAHYLLNMHLSVPSQEKEHGFERESEYRVAGVEVQKI